MIAVNQRYWPSARHFTEAVQCPTICFSAPQLRRTLPAVDRLGMPLVTSGQFAYVYKLNSDEGSLAVRCFRGYLKDRDERYRAIQNNLRKHVLPFLSDVTYASEGILVEGQRFPILFMKWIEGPTLDLYLEQVVGRREVMLRLMQDWVHLVTALRKAGIAHGDLQHGNVIVERGNVRLVDHDGMFTPEMEGWISSELGHQHYQHPRRDERVFNARLDNFSALVIYLSLMSLAEKPGLWANYHDENLLFSRSDFVDPESSSLFAEIKELGPEHRRLAEVLEEASRKDPSDTPFLNDLVSVTSSLPSWMTAPFTVEPQTKTREVIAPEDSSNGRGNRWKPWKPRVPASRLPWTTPSSSYQTIFSGPATDPSLAAKAPAGSIPGMIRPPLPPKVVQRDPDKILLNTGHFAREFLRRTFLWWYWGIYLCLKFIGLDFLYAILLAVTCLVIGSLAYGLVRAMDLARNASKPLTANPLQLGMAAVRPAPPPPQIKTVLPHPAPVSVTATEPIIGNSRLSIYHLNHCSWAEKISPRNRIGFTSATAALANGYKPCKVCSP